MTPEQLRAAVRECVLSCGGAGFVRFSEAGCALFATDAPSRMPEADAGKLMERLKTMGFSCFAENAVTFLIPGRKLLREMCAEAEEKLNRDSEELTEISSLGIRWHRIPAQEWDESVEQLLADTARILWKAPEKVCADLKRLRNTGAALQREHSLPGLHEAGNMLLRYAEERRTEK